jgi:hypothetical protein
MSKDNQSTQGSNGGSKKSNDDNLANTPEENKSNKSQRRINTLLRHLKTCALEHNASSPVAENKELIDLVLEGSGKIQSIHGKKVVVVCGATGSGKSTLIGYLIGKRMRLTNSEGTSIKDNILLMNKNFDYDPDDNRRAPNIGFGELAETTHPETYKSYRQNDDLCYLDLAGFFENRKGAYQVWSPLASDLAIQAADEISGVVITMQEVQFKKVDRNLPQFKKLSAVLRKVFFTNSKLSIFSEDESAEQQIGKWIQSLKSRKSSHADKTLTVVITAPNRYLTKEEVKYHFESQFNEKIKALENEYTIGNLSSLLEQVNHGMMGSENKSTQIDILLAEINLLAALAQSHIVIGWDYLNDDVYQQVTDNIKETAAYGISIPKSRLSFTVKGDPDQIAFETTMSDYATRALSVLTNFAELEKTIPGLRGVLKALKTDPNDKTLTELSDKFFYSEEVNTVEAKIKSLKKDIEAINTDDPVLYYQQIWEASYSWFFWLGLRPSNNFIYPPKKIDGSDNVEKIHPIQAEITDQKGVTPATINADGSINQRHTAEKQKVTLRVFVKSKDLPQNRNKIETYNKDITDLKNELDKKRKEFGEQRVALYTRYLAEKESTKAYYENEIDNNLNNYTKAAYIMRLFRHSDFKKLENALKDHLPIKKNAPPPVFLPTDPSQMNPRPDPQSQPVSGSDESDESVEKILGIEEFNPYLYAIMSELAYYKPADFLIRTHRGMDSFYLDELETNGWKLLQNKDITGYISVIETLSAYSAHIFVHDVSKSIVIAHRGTKSLGDLVTADLEMFMQQVPRQYYRGARELTRTILEHDLYHEYSLSHTGHSLGGSLAIFACFESKTPAVVFDPYGVKNITDLRRLTYNPMVTAFFSGMNVINATSAHHGLLFQIQPHSDESDLSSLTFTTVWNFIRKYHSYTKPSEVFSTILKKSLALHNIEGIRQVFDTENHLPVSCIRVLKWPDNVSDFLGVNVLHDKNRLPTNQAINPNTISNPNLVRTLADYYQTEEVGSITQLSADSFPQKFITQLKKTGRNAFDFDPKIISLCELKFQNGKEMVVFKPPHNSYLHLLHIKLYAERVIGEKNQNDKADDFKALITEREIATKEKGFRKSPPPAPSMMPCSVFRRRVSDLYKKTLSYLANKP